MLSISFISLIFLAGLLSFLSPCILPIIPIYLSYLVTEKAEMQKTSIIKSLLFVLGLSLSFFILGFSTGFIGGFINNNYFYILLGIVIILFGLHQIGILNVTLLNKEKKLDANFNPKKGIVGAFLLGFLLSFGWTPCVGPILASVLAFTANNGSSAVVGGLLLLVYSLGLSIPFIIVALLHNKLQNKIKIIYTHFNMIKIIGGIIIILFGSYTIYQRINMINLQNQQVTQPQLESTNNISPKIYNQFFDTVEQKSVKLSDFKGKKVYIKFWASWCPICLGGLDELNELAEQEKTSNDVVILSVASPGVNNEMTTENFKDWAKSQNLKFTTLLDPSGKLLQEFKIRGYPTSVYLDMKGNLTLTKIGHNDNIFIRKQLSKE